MPHKVISNVTDMTDKGNALLRKADCQVEVCEVQYLSDDELPQRLKGVDAIIAAGEPWPERAIEAAGPIKILARCGVGYDEIDIAAAAKRGIWVTNTPDATSNAVSDWTIALMLELLRSVHVTIADMKAKVWNPIEGCELASLTVGIIGVGAIGRQVIKRLHGFGAKVLACDIVQDQIFADRYEFKYVSLEQLLTESDVLSIHCPLNEHTRGILNEQSFRLMKSTAYLVNTARPGIADEQDLVKAIKEHQIAGAAIDVHDPKPARPEDPLLNLDNVITTPWNAYNSTASNEKMRTGAAQEVVTVLQGGTPRNPVNQPQ